MELVLWHMGGMTLHKLYWTVRCGGKREMGGMAVPAAAAAVILLLLLFCVLCADLIMGTICKL